MLSLRIQDQVFKKNAMSKDGFFFLLSKKKKVFLKICP